MLVINNLLLDVSPLPAGLYCVLLCMYVRLSECVCVCVSLWPPLLVSGCLRGLKGLRCVCMIDGSARLNVG